MIAIHQRRGYCKISLGVFKSPKARITVALRSVAKSLLLCRTYLPYSALFGSHALALQAVSLMNTSWTLRTAQGSVLSLPGYSDRVWKIFSKVCKDACRWILRGYRNCITERHEEFLPPNGSRPTPLSRRGQQTLLLAAGSGFQLLLPLTPCLHLLSLILVTSPPLTYTDPYFPLIPPTSTFPFLPFVSLRHHVRHCSW